MARKITDDELLAAVLSSKTYAEAARVLGVSKNTVTRRLQNEELYSRLLRMRKDVLSVVNQSMIARSLEAVDTMYSLMNNSESDSVRLSAADRFVTHMERLIEDENIIDEIRRMQIEDKLRREQE